MWTIILYIILAILLVPAIDYLCLLYHIKKHRDGKHHCNRCECSFLHTKDDLARIYCPYCGNALERHKNAPDYEQTGKDGTEE